MRSIEFPYIVVKGSYIPSIPVFFLSDNKWKKRWAYVDSGATYSLFDLKEAEGLNVDLSHAPQRFIVVGDGGMIRASFVKLPIRIGDVEFQAEIGFSEKLRIGVNLLGRKDIFEKFQVCFSDVTKVVSFTLL